MLSFNFKEWHAADPEGIVSNDDTLNRYSQTKLNKLFLEIRERENGGIKWHHLNAMSFENILVCKSNESGSILFYPWPLARLGHAYSLKVPLSRGRNHISSPACFPIPLVKA